MRSSPRFYWAIGLVGIASIGIYFAAFTLPYWLPKTYGLPSLDMVVAGVWAPVLGVIFVAGFAALLVLYFVAYRLASHHQTGLGAILFFTTLFGLCLIWMYPITAADLFTYDFQGQMMVRYQVNPYAHTPNEFPDDPAYPFVAFKDLHANYGPAWLLLEAVPSVLADDQRLVRLLLFKTIVVVAHLANAGLIWVLLEDWPPEHRGARTLLYAWNPLLLLETAGNGHNDALMMSFILLSLCFVQRRQWLWVLPALALGALIKFVSLLWVPLFVLLLLRQMGFNRRALATVCLGGLAALALTILVYAPLWAGAETFRGLKTQDVLRGLSLPLAIILVWQELALTESLAKHAESVTRGLSLIVLAVVYIYQSKSMRGLSTLISACFWTGLTYLIVVNLQPQPWYLIWLFPLAVLSSSRNPMLISHALSIALFIPYIPGMWLLAAQPVATGFAIALLTGVFVCFGIIIVLLRRKRG